MNPEKMEEIADSFSHRADWSTLMSGLHDDLAKAEGELRVVHMGEGHRHKARMHLDDAMIALKLLKGWCGG